MFDIFNNPAFLFVTLALILLALGFTLLPVLSRNNEARSLARKRRAIEELRDDLSPEDYRSRLQALHHARSASAGTAPAPRGLLPALALIIPLATLWLYLEYGTPDGLRAPTGEVVELRQQLGELAAQVNRQPQDVEAWSRLGLIWKNLGQYQAAEAAFRRVLFIDGANAFAAVELAETLLFASGRARLPAESRFLLDQVINQDRENQKALWLAGMGALHEGNVPRAIALWVRLEQLLPEGSVRDQVRQQIDQARGQLAMGDPHAGLSDPHAGIDMQRDSELPPPRQQNAAPATAPDAVPETSASNTGVAEIPVRIELSEQLADRLNGSETLFVFARAVNGPPAPLAVQRHRAADLPLDIILSDRDAMAEGLTLATFPQVSISARISRTGNAIASAGDLQGHSPP
ncbi:MAG: tetratricopeptide repeat protein, partial [Wenzhouxiangellaceae bacterium]